MWNSLGGTVDRALRDDTWHGAAVRVLTVQRVYDAEPADVWHAVTTRERVSRWLGPTDGDFRLGGRFQVQGNAGGEVLRCQEPELLEVTWEFGGQTSWVVVTLTGEDGGTRLRLEHGAAPNETWDQFGPGAVGIGWEMALGGLRMNLAAPDADPGEPDFRHPAYADFVRRAGAAWAEADAAAGTDPETARAAADRCVAAYTELPPEEGADEGEQARG